MSDTQTEPTWLSTIEVAKRIGVTPHTVRELINDGKLTGYKIGRLIRIRDDDVVRCIRNARILPGELDHLSRRKENI